MKLVLPSPHNYGTNPVVVDVLQSQGLWKIVDRRLLIGDDGYRQMMRQLWEAGETFINIEHDIIPWPGAIEELWGCPCEWGTYSYRYHGGIGIAHMLGLAKITDKLIKRLPDLWDEPAHWSQLDQKLFFAAREIGQEPHLHRPPVIHLNPKELA